MKNKINGRWERSTSKRARARLAATRDGHALEPLAARSHPVRPFVRRLLRIQMTILSQPQPCVPIAVFWSWVFCMQADALWSESAKSQLLQSICEWVEAILLNANGIMLVVTVCCLNNLSGGQPVSRFCGSFSLVYSLHLINSKDKAYPGLPSCCHNRAALQLSMRRSVTLSGLKFPLFFNTSV